MDMPDELGQLVQQAKGAATSAANSAAAAKASAEGATVAYTELMLSKSDKQPHKYTIRLAVFSIVLTFIAVFFTGGGYFNSLDSLKAARDSLHVGQRAYLAVKAGRLKLVNQKVLADYYNPEQKKNGGWSYTNPKDMTRVDWKHLRAEFSFELENVGNSPAKG